MGLEEGHEGRALVLLGALNDGNVSEVHKVKEVDVAGLCHARHHGGGRVHLAEGLLCGAHQHGGTRAGRNVQHLFVVSCRASKQTQKRERDDAMRGTCA